MGIIIVATDGSDAAVKAAATGFELARQTGDAVTIVVVREILRGSLGLPFAHYDQQLFDEYHAKAERVLEAAVDQAERVGVIAGGVALDGEPVAEICRFAARTDARLIVVGAHGWGPLRSLVLGSVAAGVLREAPCPVLCGTPGTRAPTELQPRPLVSMG